MYLMLVHVQPLEGFEVRFKCSYFGHYTPRMNMIRNTLFINTFIIGVISSVCRRAIMIADCLSTMRDTGMGNL